jgi:hypothetical protein
MPRGLETRLEQANFPFVPLFLFLRLLRQEAALAWHGAIKLKVRAYSWTEKLPAHRFQVISCYKTTQ